MRINKPLKITGIIVLVVGVLVLGAHMLVINRAKQILNYMVMEASNDRYMVRKGKVRIHYFPFTIDASKIQVAPVDTSGKNNFYITAADSISIHVSSLFSLLGKKHLSLENIRILRPQVEVYDRDTLKEDTKKPLNIVLGDIQHALLTALSDFSITNCTIEDGGLFYNQNKKDNRPLFINHVWLNIRNLKTLSPGPGSERFFNADIELRIRKPLIQLPDPSMELYLDNILLDTRKNLFTINSLDLYDKNKQGTVDSIKLSNVSLHHFNWNRWLKEGLIEIDSLKANNGATFFDLSGNEIFAKKKNNQSTEIKKRYPDFLLHHVEINKIGYGLRLKSDSGPFKLEINGDSLAIGDISLTGDSEMPIKVGSVAFKLSDFSNNFDSRQNESSFEKLFIDHNNLQLINYRRTLNFKNMGAGSRITIPALKVVNFSLDDLLQFRLVAERLILERPSLIIDAQEHKKRRSADEAVAQIAASLRPSLSIEELSIRDASIILLTTQKNGGKLSIEKLNTEINANELLQAGSVLEMITSATALSSSGFLVTGPNINLLIQRSKLNQRKDGLLIEKVIGDIGPAIHVDLNEVALVNEHTHVDINNLHEIPIEFVDVGGGFINIDLTRRKNGNDNKMPAFLIAHLNTGNIQLEVTSNNSNIKLDEVRISGEKITAEKDYTSWKYLDVQSSKASFNTKQFSASTSRLHIKQPGIIRANNVEFVPVKEGLLKKISVPALNIEANYDNTRMIRPEFRELVLDDPIMEFNQQINHENGETIIPAFRIDHFMANRPSLKIYDGSELVGGLIRSEGSLQVSGLQSKSDSKEIIASAITLHFLHPLIHLNENDYEPGSVSLKATSISYNAVDQHTAARIDSASVAGLDLAFKGNKTSIKGLNTTISSFQYESSDSITLSTILNHKYWKANSKELHHLAKNHELTVFNPSFSSSPSTFLFDSLHLIPLLTRDNYWNSFPYEKDYNTLKLGQGIFENWKIEGGKGERKFNALHATIDDLRLLTEKDKTRGPDTAKYRPLLVKTFEKIPVKISVDTLSVNNGYVWHNLIPEKSKKQASIFFSSIQGNLFNVKNYNILPRDTFRFRLASTLMGKGDLVVGYREAYSDTLQGFSLRAKMGNFELASLNPLLVPLVSVKIDRGSVDSMLLAVGANDYIAYGSMDMRYHGLRLALLKNGEKEYFLSRFFNLLINTFVHSKDESGKDIIFQERLRNKSIFNFWGKIAINGLLSSLGVKRDKQQVRKYNKATRPGGFPPVDPRLL